MYHGTFFFLRVTGKDRARENYLGRNKRKVRRCRCSVFATALVYPAWGKNFWELQPLFPGYIFVCTEDSLVPKDMMLLRKVKGVAHFLPSNEDVRCLNEQDYALVQQFLSFGEIAEPSTAFFDKDDRIVLVDGPMKGMEGQITSVDRRKRRVKLVVTMFDTEMTLNLSYNLIEKKDS